MKYFFAIELAAVFTFKKGILPKYAIDLEIWYKQLLVRETRLWVVIVYDVKTIHA